MNVKFKVCGITNWDDASRCVFYGASALGFIFYKKSPRYISPSRAKKIISKLPPFISSVGVFVDPKEGAIKDVCRFTGIDTVQLHGNESPTLIKRLKGHKIIKAFHVDHSFQAKDVKKYDVDAYLFDAKDDELLGGTGKTFDWEGIAKHKWDKPIILAGGINKDNVLQAIEKVKPYAVDLSSSLEDSPGKKSPAQIREFFEQLGHK